MQDEPTEFSFDFWAKLARDDPASFEHARKLMVASLIESAPASAQQRLRGLQWQIDHLRERTTTPLSACLKISNLMWGRVLGEGGLVENIDNLTNQQSPRPRASAKILPIRPEHGEN